MAQDVERLKDAYILCVNRAFIETEPNGFLRDGNIPAAVERSFVDCQTEENAFYATLVDTLVGLTAPTNQATLTARGALDRIKARLKSDLMITAHRRQLR